VSKEQTAFCVKNAAGGMDYSGRISKHGDAMPRALLHEAANSLLTVVRRAHPLNDGARRIRTRTSHKKARVAPARKLAVIPYRMPITGEAFRWPEKEAATTATTSRTTMCPAETKGSEELDQCAGIRRPTSL